MAITQALCTSFKVEIGSALHNFTNPGGDTFKMALFRDTAAIVGTFGAGTTNYSDMGADEVTGTNYVAGGVNLVSNSPFSSGTTAIYDFDDVSFSNVTITTRGALIYNSSQGNRAVMVLDFGSDKVASASDLSIQFPAADAASAILRIT